MKKGIWLIIVLSVLCLCGCHKDNIEQQNTAQLIRVITDYTTEDAAYRQLERFKKQVEEATENAVEIKIYAKGEWDSPESFCDYVQADMVEMACLSSNVLAENIAEYELYNYPCLFANALEVAEYGIHKGTEALEYCTEDNLQALGFIANGYFFIAQTQKNIVRETDFNGMLLYGEERKVYKKALQKLGMNLKSDVLPLTGTNRLANEGLLAELLLVRDTQTTIYVNNPRIFYDLGICIVSKNWWDSLDETTQQAFRTCFKQGFERECNYQNQEELTGLFVNQIKENYLTEEVREKIYQTLWPMTTQYIMDSGNPLGQAFYVEDTE